jgi:2-dehydro-3-deoxyphosphogluconate aldolase/(4S)-4-hydroxy-2-oxoglutarate aldolase
MAGWDASARLLGIVRYRDAGDVDGALGALVRGGIRLVEVTLDTPGALAAVERGRRSGWSIGVGTVLESDHVDRSVDAGAAFVVSPGLVPPVIERALELGVDVVPGAFTPTEVMRAHARGVDVVKLFPASLGGPSVRAISSSVASRSSAPSRSNRRRSGWRRLSRAGARGRSS